MLLRARFGGQEGKATTASGGEHNACNQGYDLPISEVGGRKQFWTLRKGTSHTKPMRKNWIGESLENTRFLCFFSQWPYMIEAQQQRHLYMIVTTRFAKKQKTVGHVLPSSLAKSLIFFPQPCLIFVACCMHDPLAIISKNMQCLSQLHNYPLKFPTKIKQPVASLEFFFTTGIP